VFEQKFKQKELLGLSFVQADLADFVAGLAEFVLSDRTARQLFLATPNPEILLTARYNPEFLAVLKRVDCCTVDGFGLVWADWFLAKFADYPVLLRVILVLPSVLFFGLVRNSRKKIALKRLTGVDLLAEILAKNEDLPLFLLGGAAGVAESVRKNYPNAQIVGVDSGSSQDFDRERLVAKINASGAKVLFVAFGAPKQEIWLSQNLSQLPQIKLACGVGGAFDFLADPSLRAGAGWRKWGLEWVWRLLKQPWRVGRIFRAVVKFPLLIAFKARDFVL